MELQSYGHPSYSLILQMAPGSRFSTQIRCLPKLDDYIYIYYL